MPGFMSWVVYPTSHPSTKISSRTSEDHLIWWEVFTGVVVLKRGHWSRLQSSRTSVFIKSGNLDTDTPAGGRHGENAISSKDHLKLPEDEWWPQNRSSATVLRRNRPSWHLDFGLLSPQNCDKIEFCYLQPPGVRYLVTAALGINPPH